jgi:hypothetical protein
MKVQMKRLSLLITGCLLSSVAAMGQNICSLPQSSDSAGTTVTAANITAIVSIGLVAGTVRAAGTTLGIGLQNVSRAGFTCFLSTNAPLGVAALSGTSSVQRLVPTARAAMTLEWTSGFNPLPVTYTVYTGTQPFALSVFTAGITGTSQLLSGLSYQTPYYWQIVASDQFGRTTPSSVYSFSIVPVVDHLIAAPNPFHPGNGTTTFLFSMPGQGSANLEIFSLPDGRRVYQTQIGGLQDGANLYTYDGRDSGGRFLGNGVFTVRLTKNGANGNEVDTFKIVSVR